jgi:DNA repair exonuclease SbcCD nuclease subunit
VFSRFYDELRLYEGNGIIYVGGDIAHAKTQMSPELVFQISKFFKSLADIAPTIVITGNHDANMNNPNRMDVLSPIIDNITHDNLHYLKDSGVYHMADVSFAVMGIFDKMSSYIKANDFEGKTKIALFHGALNASKTDFGYTLPSKMKTSRFANYDMTMLGDIHKMQYLNRKKTIAYCGSLICQNHGESLNKGFLK